MSGNRVQRVEGLAEVPDMSGRVALVTGANEPASGDTVAEHRLVAPSVRDEHYGGPRPAPRRAVRPRTVAENRSAPECP
jgi:hypothetical protein